MSTRLPGPKYKAVFDRGRPAKGRLLVAWRLDVNDADRLAGVVVSKKTFHEAVDRARAKRLMREAFRLLVKADEVPPKTNWILIGRAGLLRVKCAEVMTELRKLCARSSSCS